MLYAHIYVSECSVDHTDSTSTLLIHNVKVTAAKVTVLRYSDKRLQELSRQIPQ